MSFAQPPSRRERLSRLPAFAQYEDRSAAHNTEPGLMGPASSEDPEFPGTASYPGTGRLPYQGPPWEPEPWGGQPRESQPRESAPWETRPQPPVQGQPADFAPRRRVTGSFEALPDQASSGLAGKGRSRGLLAGAFSGLLAAALSLGVANLVAAFVRPQASPIIAVGEAFIDRTPPWLKNFAVQTFGENDKNMLLLGMYVTIALLAMGIGTIAWRHVSAGVVALALFGAFGAFVALTRPESHTTDVIPSIAGGIAGIAAITLLVLAGRSRPRFQTDRGSW